MKKRNWIIAVVIMLVGLASIPLVAAGRRMHEGMHGDAVEGFVGMRHLRYLKNELDLSDQQVDQLKSIAAEVREENAQYRQQMHSSFKEVAGVLINDPSATANAEQILDRNDANREQMRRNILDGVSRALKVLTPEQRAELKTLLEKHTRGL